MKKAALSLFAPLLAVQLFAQSGAVIPQGGAGHAAQGSCIILKRMGPADEVTSHLYSFGIRGKQFQYVEGKFPEGFPFHGRLTDHDVRNLQGRGADVIVLNQNFTADDLKQARADCRGETSTTPNQAEAKAAPTATAAPIATPASATQAHLQVSSVPDGADIEVDGNFVGNTPSDIDVPAGDHTLSIKKSGIKDWTKTIKITSGSNIHIKPELEKQ
jgi:hypothetical protein